MIAVVDTSALVRLATLLPHEVDDALLERLAAVTPQVPDIVDAEFLHALRGLTLGGKVSPERAEHARVLFTGIPAVRYPTRGLVDRMWALRHNLGAYDAAFVTLAEALDAPLITCDAEQASASGHRALVEAY